VERAREKRRGPLKCKVGDLTICRASLPRGIRVHRIQNTERWVTSHCNRIFHQNLRLKFDGAGMRTCHQTYASCLVQKALGALALFLCEDYRYRLQVDSCKAQTTLVFFDHTVNATSIPWKSNFDAIATPWNVATKQLATAASKKCSGVQKPGLPPNSGGREKLIKRGAPCSNSTKPRSLRVGAIVVLRLHVRLPFASLTTSERGRCEGRHVLL
jgi:hypothetical protein